MSEPVLFLFRARQLGGHVHVGVWAGTKLQADNQARPKLGDLTMSAEQWAALLDRLDKGRDSEHVLTAYPEMITAGDQNEGNGDG